MQSGQQTGASGSDATAAAQPGCSAAPWGQSALQNKPSPDCLSFWTPQTGYAKAVQPPHLIGEVQQLSLAQNKEKETNKVTTNK